MTDYVKLLQEELNRFYAGDITEQVLTVKLATHMIRQVEEEREARQNAPQPAAE